MHALFFTFGPCKAVLQTSLIGWISSHSVLCPPCSHGLFLSSTKEKRQNYKEEYVYGRNEVQRGSLHLSLHGNRIDFAVPHGALISRCIHKLLLFFQMCRKSKVRFKKLGWKRGRFILGNSRMRDLQGNGGLGSSRWFCSWCQVVNGMERGVLVGWKVSRPVFWKCAYILIPEGTHDSFWKATG